MAAMTVIYMVCLESIQPINIKKKVTDLEQWHLGPLQSTPLATSHTYPSVSSTFQNNLKSPFSELPSAASSCSPEPRLWSEISSLSMTISVSRKARSHREPIWAVGGLTDLGDAMFYQKSLHES